MLHLENSVHQNILFDYKCIERRMFRHFLIYTDPFSVVDDLSMLRPTPKDIPDHPLAL